MANIRTIDYSGFNHATGSAASGSGFMLWSGSMELSKSEQDHTVENYYGVGAEFVAHSGSYFRYRTNTDGSGTSELDIKTDTFHLGSDTTFISGSGDGSIAISSSNFELGTDGAVVMQGTITAEAGGTIGGFTIGTSSLSTTTFQLSSSLNADDPVSFISSSDFKVSADGRMTASAGRIGGWTLSGDSGIQKSFGGNSNIHLRATAGGIIGRGLNIYMHSLDVSDGEVNIVRVGEIGEKDSINLLSSNIPYGFQVGKKDADGNQFDVIRIGSDDSMIAGWTINSESFDGGAIHINKGGYISSSTNWAISSSEDTADPAGFISSSDFKVSADGRVSGSTVLFTGGKIGNFNIKESGLNSDSGEFQITGSTGQITGSTVLFTGGKIGNFNIKESGLNSDSGEFQITGSTGQITGSTVLFTGGKIAAWHIESDFLKSNSGSIVDITLGNISGMYLDGGSSPQIYMNPGNGSVNENVKMFFNADDDFGLSAKAGSSTPVFELGSTNQIAGWTFDEKQISSTNLILSSSGTIQTANFVSSMVGGLAGAGFKIGADGIAEFEEARIRGTLSTAVFEKETVSAVGGALIVANATAISSGSLILSSSLTGDPTPATPTSSLPVDSAAGFAVGEYILAKATSSLGFTEEVMQITAVDTTENILSVSRSMNNHLIDSMSSGQVLVSQGKKDTGFILLNATSGSETPYIDITERTGSGIDDLDIKVRLGDLSGISDATMPSVAGFGLYTDNVFLKGTISSSAGNIGGIDIGESRLRYQELWTISSSADTDDPAGYISSSNFKVSADGRVTASAINVEGTISSSTGNIGGFTIGSSTLSTTAFQFSSSQEATDPVSFISSSNFKVSADGRITASAGQIASWYIDSTTIGSGSSQNQGGQAITFNNVSTAGGTTYQSNVTTAKGLHIQTHENSNASSLIVGEIISDANGNHDYSTPAFNNWYGIQATRWNQNTPFFQLAFKADGTFTTNNSIAGWSFDNQALEGGRMHLNKQGYISSSGVGGWMISSSNDATDPVGFISSSDFKVSADGRMTASAALIEGDSVFGGSLTVGAAGAGNIHPSGDDLILFHPLQDYALSTQGYHYILDYSGLENHSPQTSAQGLVKEDNFQSGSNGGPTGGSYYFDGDAGILAGYQIGGNGHFTNGGDYTVAFWTKKAGLSDSAFKTFFMAGKANTWNNTLALFVDVGSGVDQFFNAYDGNGVEMGKILVPSASVQMKDTWRHIAVVYPHGSQGTLYIDGNLMGTFTASNVDNAVVEDITTVILGADLDNTDTIGSFSSQKDDEYSGSMSDFRIYKKALAHSEIYALYASPGQSTETTKIDGNQLNTGIIHSNNWSSTLGTEINLNDGTFKFGGSSDPDLQFDGTTLTVSGTLSSSVGNIGGWTIETGKLSSGPLMINANKAFFSSSVGGNTSSFGWRISSSADDDDTGGFISSSGFNVSPSGLVSAVNFSERYVIVDADNSSSYFKNNNNYDGSGNNGVTLVYDGSKGGFVTMNMQLDTLPWNTTNNAQKPITNILLPNQGAGTQQLVTLTLNVDGVTFSDDGPMAPNTNHLAK